MDRIFSEVRLPLDCRITPVKEKERVRVYRIVSRDETYFLKTETNGDMQREGDMLSFLHARCMGAQVVRGGSSWLLTRALPGVGGAELAAEDPARTAFLFGRAVRRLHELDIRECPVKNPAHVMMEQARRRYLERQADAGLLQYVGCADMDAAFREMEALWERHRPMDDAVIHGDCCLPNLIACGDLAGWIDCGYGGVGPRHYDLFWAQWSVRFNCKSRDAVYAFRAANGETEIDDALVRLFGLISCFNGYRGRDIYDPAEIPVQEEYL